MMGEFDEPAFVREDREAKVKAKKRACIAFMNGLADLCQKYHVRLEYAGCGSHKIDVDNAELGSDIFEDFTDNARALIGLPPGDL